MPEKRLRRLELWNDIEAASGDRQQSTFDVESATTRDSLDGIARLSIDLQPTDPCWSAIQEEWVLRTILSTDDWREWRIRDIEDARQEGVEASVEAVGIRQDLGRRSDLVSRTEADGSTFITFNRTDLKPLQYVEIILDVAPDHFSIGTIDPTAKLDFGFDAHTPLSALTELAEATNSELDVQKGTSTYTVNLLSEVGQSHGETPLFTVEKNLIDQSHRTTSKEQGTRVYGVGGDQERRLTLADAEWKVSSVSGSTLSLNDTPIRFDGQLVGFYVEKPDGSTTEVTASDAGNDTVTVADASGISGDDFIRFVETSAGDDLLYLEHPDDVDTWGPVVKTVERTDLPAVHNLVSNPFLDIWGAGVPNGYNIVNSPTTVAEATADTRARNGESSAFVEASALGQGLETEAIDVGLTKDRPFLTAQINLWVVSGSVRLELYDVTNDRTWPMEGEVARTSVQDRWVADLAVAPGAHNFFSHGTQQAKVRVLSHSSDATWYLDAVQLTRSDDGHDFFFQGNAANRLWDAVNDRLEDDSQPRDKLSTTVIDLERLRPQVNSVDEIVLGADVHVKDPERGKDIETRVVEVSRNLLQPVKGDVKLSAKREDLVGKLGRKDRRTRKPGEVSDKRIPWQAPSMQWEPTQPGPNTGHVVGQVTDPALVVQAVEFKKLTDAAQGWDSNWKDGSGEWDVYSGDPGADVKLDREEDVPLQKDHLSAIKVRVRYLAEDLETELQKTFSHSFDLDRKPEVFFGLTIRNDTVFMSYEGDEDTKSIEVSTSKSSFSDADFSSPTTVDGQDGDGVDLGAIAEEETMYVKVRGYTETGASGQQGPTHKEAITYTTSGELVSVEPDASQNNGNGELSLNIVDPKGLVESVCFATISGFADFDDTDFSCDSSAPFDTTETVALSPKHPSHIKWRVKWTDSGGQTHFEGGTVTYDLDKIPEVEIQSVTESANDTALISVKGDGDTGDVVLTWNIGSDPNAPADPDETSTAIGGRSGVFDTGDSVEKGDIIHIKARGHTGETDSNGNLTAAGLADAEFIAEAVIKIGPGIIKPEVKVIPDQSGGQGTVTLEIDDPQNRVNATAFDHSSGGGDWTPADPPDSSWAAFDNTTSDGLNKTHSADIHSKHPLQMAWGVRYEDKSGSNVWKVDTLTFDIGTEPNVQIQGVTFDENGQAVVSLKGDEDTTNIYVTWSVGASPSDPSDPTTDDAALGSRSGTLNTGALVPEGEVIHIKARGYNGSSLADVANIAEITKRREESVSAPDVEIIAEQDGSGNGTITISYVDLQGRINATAFDKAPKSGGAWTPGSDPSTWSVFDTSSPPQSSYTVEIGEKHPRQVAWGVRWQDDEGTNRWKTGTHTFDIDRIPDVDTPTLDVDANGNVIVHVGGDEDTGSIAIEFSGAFTESTTIDGRTATYTSSGQLSDGESVTVTVTGWSGTGGTGTSGESKSSKASFQSGGGPGAPSVDITISSVSSTSITYEITAEAGPDGSPSNLEIETRIDDVGGSGTWASEATGGTSGTLTTTKSVSRPDGASGNALGKVLKARAIDNGVDGNPKSSADSMPVFPQGLDPGDLLSGSIPSGVQGPNGDAQLRDIKRDDNASEGDDTYNPGTLVVKLT